MAIRCGIDFGATYSSISWYDRHNTRVDTIDLESADGAKTVRSVVYFPGAGEEPVIGERAWKVRGEFVDRVIVGIEHSLGSHFRTPPIDGVEYTAPQISANILRALTRDAEIYLGEQVQEVVITVPDYFGEKERAATEEAGKLAGLNVLATMPESHAVALAFAIDKFLTIANKYLLVYNLGGKTFNLTLLHTKLESVVGNSIGLSIDTLCRDGSAFLGGEDWDHQLAGIVAERAMQCFGVDVWQDHSEAAVLLDNCEKAKRYLSKTDSVRIAADLANHDVEVSRSEFEARTTALLLQTEMLLDRVLDDGQKLHGVGIADFDVLLAGGSSRMPMVQAMIQAKIGKPPLKHTNPELLATIGAAYWAYLLEGTSVTKQIPGQTRVPQPPAIVALDRDVVLGMAFARMRDQVRPAGALEEPFRCSVFYPERVAPGAIGRVVASVHLETAAGDVVREAVKRLDLPSAVRVKAASQRPELSMLRQSLIDITPDVPGLVFETPRASMRLWEDQQSVEFRFKAYASSAGVACRGWVHFWLEGVILADIPVVIFVADDDVPEIFRDKLAEANTRPYRRVFPSYSHDDAEVVKRLELYAASFGDEYLRDVSALRAGQRWNEGIQSLIRGADVFQLFWSEKAATSVYVEHEWREALIERDNRPDPFFVRPVYWTQEPAPIPPELKHLHFARTPLQEEY